MATRRDTWDYYHRFTDAYGRTYFRRFGAGVAASVGIGTRLGDPTEEADRRSRQAIVSAIENGCNVVDTAADYRQGRSELVVGRALDDADVSREAVHVTTKGGIVPFDGERPDDPVAFVRERYAGAIDPADLVGGRHCIEPRFLASQVDRSLDRLGVDAVDCYFVQDPERQLATHSPTTVYDRLEAAFELLEERAAAGDLRGYGVATWDAFRVPRNHDRHLALPEVISRARAAADSVGNETTGFRAIQLPFNVLMADAYTVEAHDGPDGRQSALAFARDAGLSVVASAALAGGGLAEPGAIPADVDDLLVGETPAQRAINFARSGPAVTCALVGTQSTAHVAENLAAGTFDAMGADAFDAVFE